MRYNIHDGGFNGVSVGLQALAKLPVQSQDYRVNKVLPKVLLLLGWNPSSGITLTGNAGVEFDGVNDNPAFIHSMQASFLMAPKIGCYIENYNTLAYSYEHLNAGLYFFATNNFQLDASVGYGFRKNAYDTFFGLGLTYRFAASRNTRHRWVYGEYR